MRLFIALQFDQDTKEKIRKIQQRLIKGTSCTPTLKENFHITLAFLGEVEEGKVEKVFDIIEKVFFPSMELIFDHIGTFPTGEKGDLWWLGIAENPALLSVEKTLRSHLKKEGFLCRHTVFSPHVTLARQLILQKEEGEKRKKVIPFSARVEKLEVMCSNRIQGKLTYTKTNRRKEPATGGL
ncbi:MAG: RNA 2',3'-cyclic phosphodiesterase [Clostridiales bacterium]|nr:RNA 2',3'-cyclic phosphodiesterase [Clostridiales bacterium]